MADHGFGDGGTRNGERPQREPGTQSDVVALSEVAGDLRFPVVNTLETYWNALRGTRLVPARSEVDPRRIEDALEYAFILERIAPGMARFRLAGMHLNDLMGMEVRGMPLTAFFSPPARKQVSEALEQVFDEPAIARLKLSAERGVGRPPMDARLLLLPLQSDFGDVSRALGCLTTAGPVGRAPRRFDVTREEISLLAGDGHAGDRRVKGWSRKAAPGRATAQPPRGTTPVPQAGRPATPPAALPAPGFAAPDQPGYGPRNGQGDGKAAPRPPRSDGPPKLFIVPTDD